MLRPAPRVPAGPNSLAALYARAADLEESLDEAAVNAPQLHAACHRMPLAEIAIGAMSAPPGSITDLALTLGIAATWSGFVTDAIDEATSQHAVGLAIGTALDNAVLLLANVDGPPVDGLPIDGEARNLLNKVLAEIHRGRDQLAAVQS